jgi:predicted nuclease with TOPRIM domain
MDFRRKRRINAIQARLEICAAERDKLLRAVTTTGANLGRISNRVDEIQNEFRRLTNELKVLEMKEPEEE